MTDPAYISIASLINVFGQSVCTTYIWIMPACFIWYGAGQTQDLASSCMDVDLILRMQLP